MEHEKTPTIQPSEVAPPPQAPEMDRTIDLPPKRWLGIGMLALIVGLAAFGVFGERRGAAQGRSASLDLRVEYPTRFRYKQIDPLRIFVTNRSARPIDTLTVSFDTAYIAPFSNVTFTPSASRAWEVQLAGVRPGETRRIQVGLQAERYGHHTGAVAAFFAGSDSAKAEVGTFVFP